MALDQSFFSGAFSPAKRTSPIDNTDYELSDAYKPTGSTTQPERSLTGGATAPDSGAGNNPFAPPGSSASMATPGAGTSRPNIIRDVYAPQLQKVGSQLEDAYAAPRPGAARQIFGALLSRKNPALGGLVSGETQRQHTIEPLQQEYGVIANQIGAARAADTADITNQLHESQADLAMSRSKALLAPPPKATPEEQDINDLMKPGSINPATQKPYTFHEARDAAAQGIQDTKPDKTLATPKQSEEDKALGDYLQGHNLADTPANRDRARSVLKTRDKPAKDPDLADLGKQLKQAQLEKLKEPTADEQRRDDLSQNAEENLDQLQDILKRRPELFGPVAGRWTQLKGVVGTNDPDVAKLKAIREFYGMASVGAHAMRNAQHVSTAADAIMNGFANGPEGMNGAIDTARSSFKTFHENAGRRRAAIDNATGGGSTAPAPNPKDPLGIL